jgi:hypothetical protein
MTISSVVFAQNPLAPPVPPGSSAPAPASAETEKSPSEIAFDRSPYMRSINARRLVPDAKWPTIKVDQYNQQLAAAMNQASLITAAQLVCATIQKEYENFFEAEQKFTDYDAFFASNCDQLAETMRLDPHLKEQRYMRLTKQILPTFILQQFDITYYNFLVSYSKGTAVKFERLQRSYRSSLFGKLGIPFNSVFNAMQMAIVAALLLSLVAFFKSLLK